MSLPAPPKSTPTERVAEAVLSKVRTEAKFCPTVRLVDWTGVYPPPFNDAQVRQITGLFSFQVGQVERTSSSGSLFFHLVVQAPRKKPGLFESYRDWLQELLVPWGALLVAPLPLLTFDIGRRVTSGSIHDDKTTFLSQRLIFSASWELLEI